MIALTCARCLIHSWLEVDLAGHAAFEGKDDQAVQQDVAGVIEARRAQPDVASAPDPLIGDRRLVDPVAVFDPLCSARIQSNISVEEDVGIEQGALHRAWHGRVNGADLGVLSMVKVRQPVDFSEVWRESAQFPFQLAEVEYKFGRRRWGIGMVGAAGLPCMSRSFCSHCHGRRAGYLQEFPSRKT